MRTSNRTSPLIPNLEEIRSIKYTTEMMDGTMCPIDLDVFNEASEVVVTPCNHFFHRECLKEWIGNVNNKSKYCPVCKGSLAGYSIKD